MTISINQISMFVVGMHFLWNQQVLGQCCGQQLFSFMGGEGRGLVK